MLILVAVQVSATAASESRYSALTRVMPAEPCPAASNGDVLVCGRKNDPPYRLRPITGPEFKEEPASAQVNLSENVEMTLHGEGGPFAAPRAMVTLKLHF